MTFQEAIAILVNGRGIDPTIEWDAQIDEARHIVTRDILAVVGGRDDDGSLGDWIANGSFNGSETAESLAAEWIAE